VAKRFSLTGSRTDPILTLAKGAAYRKPSAASLGPIRGGNGVANPIATIIDLNGAWTSDGVTGPFISVSGNARSVDMSAYARPFAAGSVLTSSTITVTFGDDSTRTATLIPAQLGLGTLDTIHWLNSSAWTKVLIPASNLVDLNGKWVTAGTLCPGQWIYSRACDH
jgi:hypothetical protein